MERKVALITGGSRGIGRATVLAFAKNGYDVVINCLHSIDLANQLKEEVENQFLIQALVEIADVANEKQVELMVEHVLSCFGRIDVLVNNAGIAIDTTFEDKTVDNFKKTINTNLIGTFLVSKYTAEIMKKVSSGCIINISSTNGIDTLYTESLDYDASKAGVISLTKNFAVQYAPHIRVNSIAPGWVMTDMNVDLDDDFLKEEERKILLGRFAEPEEIAKVIVFLASEDASYINGEVIRVDGGSL